MHLKTDALVDIAEGTRSETSAPHLATCERCRAQVNDLRAMMSAAREVDVPDPSPLFWDHLSARVSDAVAAEAVDARLKPSRSFVGRTAGAFAALFGARAFQASAAIAALIIVVAWGSRSMAPQPPGAMLPGAAYTTAAPPPPLSVLAGMDSSTDVLGDAASGEASLMLVASLASTLDLDAASDAGLAPSGSAEHAVTHMSDGELRELGRLLKEELARSGA